MQDYELNQNFKQKDEYTNLSDMPNKASRRFTALVTATELTVICKADPELKETLIDVINGYIKWVSGVTRATEKELKEFIDAQAIKYWNSRIMKDTILEIAEYVSRI